MNKQRICITGASRGIGRELARQLAREGHHLILVARDVAKLDEARAEVTALGAAADVLVHDVKNEAPVVECDVLVNNAGTCTQELFLEQSLASQRAEFEVNYWGAVNMARAVLPGMIARKRGLIVNVSSLLGNIASPTTANYGATKAALESWSYALGRELADTGVKTTVFVAPHTQTECGDGANFEGVHSLPVTYTAAELVRSIHRAPRKYVASPVYRLLLFFARLFPEFMETRVAATATPKRSSGVDGVRS